jgi:shikimate kinase
VWLDIDFARALARVEQFAHRPLTRDPRRFEALYHARIPHYRNAGIHIRIESDDPMIVVRQIREALP